MSNAGIIVALDFDTGSEALALAAKLDPGQCRVKVGKELFTRCGPEILEKLAGSGFQVFLDLKFHDIPNTVAGACLAAAETGVWMLNVHAAGGTAMLTAAREAIAMTDNPPLLIAVTVLTSLDDDALAATGVTDGVDTQVLRLACLAQAAGLDGVVASARECAALREALGGDFSLVTPGIRPGGSGSDDQQRVMTPGEAVRAGSDYLVIGRPVTRAPDPAAVVRDINREISSL